MNDKPSESGPICIKCYVGGRVQGVFYRATTREQALGLGLTGYAKNLPDGRVEVLACGAPEAVDKLRDWLRIGPANAQVSGVACEIVDWHPLSGFTTA